MLLSIRCGLKAMSFAETAPFITVRIIGMNAYRRDDPAYRTREITSITLEKDMIRCDNMLVPIWKYKSAFVHVARERDWKWLSGRVLDQLISEEWEEFKSDRNALEARAQYFNKHGRLR